MEQKSRVYKLRRANPPISYMLPTRNTHRAPLLYFDQEKNYNRALRYARNQKSPFEDEQDGNVIVEPIIFDDGMLTVPASNPVLQEFLYYHPLNGKKFVEVDKKEDAKQELDKMISEIDAVSEAKNLDLETMELIGRVILKDDVSLMDTYTLKRDIMVFAKKNPQAFMNALSDPELDLISTVHSFFENKLLSLRNKDREVYFNLEGNKKRMTVIPFGEDPKKYLAQWFKTDDGMEALEFLEKQL